MTPSSKRDVIRRASTFFIYLFLSVAAVNILPQLFFLKVAPENKSLWLSVLLLFGTLSSVLGVELSRRELKRNYSLTPLRLYTFLLVCLVSFLGLVFVPTFILLYFAAYLLFRLVSNWLMNLTDHKLVAIAGVERIKLHTVAATLFQLVGQMLAPIVFVLLVGLPWVTATLVVVLVLTFAWAIHDAVRISPPDTMTSSEENNDGGHEQEDEATEPRVPREELNEGAPSQGSSRRFFGFFVYCLFVWMGMLGLFAQLIFLLGDYVGVAHPKKMGGLIITFVGVVSVASVSLFTRFKRDKLTHGSLLLPPVLLSLTLVIIAFKPGIWGLLGAGFLSGVGGGRFMMLTRMLASTWKGAPGRETVLSLYNNNSNYGSLIVYPAMGALALSLGESSFWFNPALFGLFFFFYLVGIVVLWLFPFVSSSSN